jgi:hypothetical protein
MEQDMRVKETNPSSEASLEELCHVIQEAQILQD